MSAIIKIEADCDIQATPSYHIEDTASLFQTCRLCLSEESVESVFNEEGLQQWISDYLSIEISSEDQLSQSVCSICCIQLMEFHQFRERCHEVQNALKSKISTEIVDSYREKVIEPSPENQEDQLLLESIQNVVTDELVDIVEMKIGTNADVETFLNLEQTTEVPVRSTGKKKQPIECKICHKMLCSKQRLKTHEIAVHKIKLFEDTEDCATEEKFHCNECPASFVKKTQLYSHNDRKHKPKKFSCTSCQMAFVKSHDLYRHFTNRHTSNQNRPFECDVCQKRFKLKYVMKEHKKRVHGPKLFECNVCGYTFKTKPCLTRHKKTHNPTV